MKRRGAKPRNRIRFANTRSRKRKGSNRFPPPIVAWRLRGMPPSPNQQRKRLISPRNRPQTRTEFSFRKKKESATEIHRSGQIRELRREGSSRARGQLTEMVAGGARRSSPFLSAALLRGARAGSRSACAATTKTGRVAAALEVGAARRTRTRRGGWACACGCGAVRCGTSRVR